MLRALPGFRYEIAGGDGVNIPARSWAMAFAVALVLWLLIFWVVAAVAQPRRYQSAARVMVQFEPQENVQSLCALIGNPNAAACANDQVMIVPNPCAYRGYYAELMCHELGHVNGWGAEHGS